MQKSIKTLLILLTLSLSFWSCQKEKNFTEGEVSLVPKPEKMELGKGAFAFSSKTTFWVENQQQAAVASQLCEKFELAAGWKPQIETAKASKTKNAIIFKTDNNLSKEAYRLDIQNKTIEVTASHPAGFFYAVQSLRQLLPVQIESKKQVANVNWLVPVCSIEDAPRFQWRGFMQDVSRHFMPKEYIKELIDYLAMHKMNTFHWHLVDDQGWRIEIKKYPKLTEVGAWRVDHEDKGWDSRPKQKKGEKATYGGFYTQEDIREIVAYAQSRFITVVPEIEMPAHTTCALAAYPEFSCTGGPFTVPPGGLWPITDIYCAGNDKTFHFLEDVITEVMELFPSEYIHIGGDEATKDEWEKCKKCQRRMRKEGLKDEHELQSYFIKRMEKFINSKGRRLIGWDEILEGGLPPQATVMSWRGFKGGLEAAKQGHDVVMTPTSHCYFDHYQGPQDYEPVAWGGYNPLSKVYSFDPVHPSMDEEAAKHVLGGQANLWSEYVPTTEQAQYMTMPRLAALAESVWSLKENKNWEDFAQRMPAQLKRYELLGINYSRSAYLVSATTKSNPENKEISVEMETELPGLSIHYTLDGSEPTASDPLYAKPVQITRSVLLKAATFDQGKLVGKVMTQKFNIHKATGKKVSLTTPPSERYDGGGVAGLVNSLRGSKNHGDGKWFGWKGDHMEAIIDLETETTLKQVSVGGFQQVKSWIFLPKKVLVYTSNDGKHYNKVGEVVNTVSTSKGETILKNFTVKFNEQKVRYVKVVAENIGVCPKDHSGAGKPSWMFVDEIEVE